MALRILAPFVLLLLLIVGCSSSDGDADGDGEPLALALPNAPTPGATQATALATPLTLPNAPTATAALALATRQATPAGSTPGPDVILPAVAAARADLAGRFERDPAEIQVISVTAQEWPDACLGLANEGEVCAQVITSGYLVTLGLSGNEYTFRTNVDGAVVRFADLRLLAD